MTYIDFGPHAEQGWQCPICKRVYAPSVPMCFYCGGGSGEATTGTKIHIKGDTDSTDEDIVEEET